MKKQKVIEAYIKTSTPQEIMYDVLEKMQEMKEGFDEMQSRIDTDVRDEKTIKQIIRPLIPKVKNGEDGKNAHTHTKEELLEIIVPLIPLVEDGKDGSPDTPEEIREKIKSLKGKHKLSVFDLKDTEYLRGGKDKMNWSSAGFKVYTDTTLTGDGSFGNPLHAISGGGAGTSVYNELVSGNTNTFTLAHTPILGTVRVYERGQRIFPGVTGYSITGAVITTVDTLLAGDVYADYNY